MSVMPETPKSHVGNDWLPTEATITACDQTFLGQESFTAEGYSPPEYRVSFSYVVDGRVLEGSYLASFPQECGHRFEILYDPRKTKEEHGVGYVGQSLAQVGSRNHHRNWGGAVGPLALGRSRLVP